MTPGDVERISAHTGRGMEGFAEHRRPADPSYADQDDDPIWAQLVFRPDGSRRVLKRQEGVGCTFLGERGCILPLDVRPLICRLYPFEYDAGGIREELSDGCPMQLLRPGETLLGSLEMTLEPARAWHEQLYQELKREA